MKVFYKLSLALSILASSVLAFAPVPAPAVPRQTLVVRKDVSDSPLTAPAAWASHPALISRLFGSADNNEASIPSGKEIDLLDEADAIFDSVDTNKDGEISADELKTHLVDVMGYSSEYTTYLFASLDTNADGVITREEMRFAFYNFEALSMYMTFGIGGSDVTSREAFKSFALKQQSGGEGRDKLLLNDLADLIFDMIDTDNSGQIDKDELRQHFDNVTNKFKEDSADQLAKEYVQTMFTTIDTDNNGTIDRQEIQAAFQMYDFKLLARTFGLRVYRTAEV